MSVMQVLRRLLARMKRVLRRRLWPILAIVLVGVVVLALIGQNVRDRLEEARAAQSENATWLVAQTEVETLKLILALQEVSPDHGPEAMAEMRQAFDIYLSRVEVMGQLYGGFAVLATCARGAIGRRVRQGTRQWSRYWIGAEPLSPDRLALALAQSQALRVPMRAFTTDALAALVATGIEGRETLAMLLSRGAELGFALIALLTLTVWFHHAPVTPFAPAQPGSGARARQSGTDADGQPGRGDRVAPGWDDCRCEPGGACAVRHDRPALLARDFRVLVPCGTAALDAMLTRGVVTSPRIELTAQRPDGQTPAGRAFADGRA